MKFLNRMFNNNGGAAGPVPPKFGAFKNGSAVKEHSKETGQMRRFFRPAEAGRRDAIEEPNLRVGDQSTWEFSVASASQRKMDRTRNEAARQLQEIDLQMKHRLPPQGSIDGDAVMTTVEDEQESTLRFWRELLVETKRTALLARYNLKAFRQANLPTLFRPAREPKPSLALVGIVAVGCIEALVNYLMLLTSGGNTPTQIFALVVLAASLNLACGMAVGFIGVRNLGHVKPARQVFGAIVTLVVSALIVTLHFSLAHYRYALDWAAADPRAVRNAGLLLERIATAKAAIGNTMLTQPWIFFQDLNAIIVFLAGIAFSAITGAEAYYLIGDPYPGYGSVYRIYRNALEAHEQQSRGLEEALAAIATRAKDGLDAIVLHARRRFDTLKAYMDAAVEVTRRYETAANTVEHELLQIVLEYRDEVRKVRENEGPQRWQEGIVTLNRDASFDLDMLVQVEEREHANLAALDDAAEQLKTKINATHARVIARLREYFEAVNCDAQHEADLLGVRPPKPPA
jgi:hypothetical protein